MVRSRAFWLLVLVFALELVVFDQFGSRRHTSVFPRWNDQVQYLTESYTGYEYVRAHGIAPGLWRAFVNRSAQGTLHDFLAILVFLVAGPSRSAALALNMLAMIAWQAALFAAVFRLRRSWPLAFASALLPLALVGPWEPIPGSAYDFRLDHLALCALGVSSAAATCTDGFRSRRGSLGFGVTVAFTMLLRFLTGTYFILIFAGLAAWILGTGDRKSRLANLLLAGAVVLIVAGPVLWLNFAALRDYYWIGHYVGAESAIRNQHWGLGASLSFVAQEAGQRHLGNVFALLAVAATAGLLLWRRRAPESPNDAPWVVSALFLAAPCLVLTLHPQKSPVVVSALVPGIVLAVICGWLAAARRASGASITAVAAITSVAAIGFFVRAQLTPVFDEPTRADIRKVNSLADQLFLRSRQAGLAEPKIAIDHITDSLEGNALRVVVYERHHVWVPFDRALPSGIFEPSEELVMARLAQSDFVFLTDDDSAGPYPFDRKVAGMRSRLRGWCEANLRLVEQFRLLGRPMVFFQRRELPLP